MNKSGLVGADGRPLGEKFRVMVPERAAREMSARHRTKFPRARELVPLPGGRALHYVADNVVEKAYASALWEEGEREDRRGLRVIAGVADFGDFGPLTFISFSWRSGGDPIWREVVMVRTAFFVAGQRVMLITPRKEIYDEWEGGALSLWEMPAEAIAVADENEPGESATYRERGGKGDPNWARMMIWRYREFSEFADTFVEIPTWPAYKKAGNRHPVKFFLSPTGGGLAK